MLKRFVLMIALIPTVLFADESKKLTVICKDNSIGTFNLELDLATLAFKSLEKIKSNNGGFHIKEWNGVASYKRVTNLTELGSHDSTFEHYLFPESSLKLRRIVREISPVSWSVYEGNFSSEFCKIKS